jgi:hypothetical protein
METLIAIAGTVITFVSFFYAIYTNRKLKKLENYNREQAWELYRQAIKVLDHMQKIEQISTNDQNIIKEAAKGEAANQELVLNAIRMIRRFEPRYDLETIESWEKIGRFGNESHIKAFKSYIEK